MHNITCAMGLGLGWPAKELADVKIYGMEDPIVSIYETTRGFVLTLFDKFKILAPLGASLIAYYAFDFAVLSRWYGEITAHSVSSKMDAVSADCQNCW